MIIKLWYTYVVKRDINITIINSIVLARQAIGGVLL